MSNNENKKAGCFFCGAPCTDEDYCHGCKESICDKCDEMGIELDFGPHSVEEHRRNE